jgi:hypothetical protein
MLPTPSELAERIKQQILEDVRAGTMPANVTSFSQLHDFVDANCYGGTEKMLEDLDKDCVDTDELHRANLMAVVAVMNPAMDIVDAWIKSGGIAKGLTTALPKANAGVMKITVYRREEQDGFSEPVACLGDETPQGDGWFAQSKAELSDAQHPPKLLMLGRAFLIYSMYHARDPYHLGIAVENFGAAVKRLGYSLPLKQDEASWLTYPPDGLDAGAPSDYQFMLGHIASVFGVDTARGQADALGVKWRPHLAARPNEGRGR